MIDQVYIVFVHDYSGYPNVNYICCVCLTEETANKKVEEYEAQKSEYKTYWFEAHDVEEEIVLEPNQIKVGSNTVMPHKERLEYLKNSTLGKLYGFGQANK